MLAERTRSETESPSGLVWLKNLRSAIFWLYFLAIEASRSLWFSSVKPCCWRIALISCQICFSTMAMDEDWAGVGVGCEAISFRIGSFCEASSKKFWTDWQPENTKGSVNRRLLLINQLIIFWGRREGKGDRFMVRRGREINSLARQANTCLVKGIPSIVGWSNGNRSFRK